MAIAALNILIPDPTSFDPAYNQQCWPEYAAAIAASGGQAVRVPLNLSVRELEAAMRDAGGLLLPGSGADVDPARYGHARHEASAPPDARREQTDLTLLAAAERWGRPILTICFGTQMLNVHRGGTLIQDLMPAPVNHRSGRSVAAAHPVTVESARLAEIVGTSSDMAGAEGKVMVNSSHHQAVGVLGAGLTIVARSPEDGVIEAVEGTESDHWILGLQWHPERTFSSNLVAKQIFQQFLDQVGSACRS